MCMRACFQSLPLLRCRAVTVVAVLFILAGVPSAQQRVIVEDSSLVGPAWSGHPVDFALAIRGDSVYAAWYHGNTRQLVVGMKAPGAPWRTRRLTGEAATVGWDSHNSIVMTIDAQGLLHVAANMHNHPLRYWRSDVPGEIDSLTQRTHMVGTQEASVTYPVFVQGPGRELIFMYRDGGSGSGNHVINKWNPQSGSWSRLLGTNLFHGASSSGTRSVYFGDNDAGPVAGPDGWYHLFWFWRATPDAGSTHRVSYMRSQDLLTWQTATGVPVTLPVSFDNNPGVIVDDVPQFAGLINRGQLGFDARNRPVISYHKHDSTVAGGYTQAYNARLENGAWVIHKTTNWPHRWSFGGQGSLVIRIQLGPVTLQPDGRLTQWYSHWELGRGIMVLNPATLQPVQILPDAYWPAALDTAYRLVNASTSGNPLQMQVNWLGVRSSKDASVVHALRWETWPENADQPRAVSPAPGQLMYYRMLDPNAVSVAPDSRQASPPDHRAVPWLLRIRSGKVVISRGGRNADLQGRLLPGGPVALP